MTPPKQTAKKKVRVSLYDDSFPYISRSVGGGVRGVQTNPLWQVNDGGLKTHFISRHVLKTRPNSARAVLAFPVTYFPIRNRIKI